MQFRDYFWTQGEPWRGLRSYLIPRLMRVMHCVLMCTVRVTTTGFPQFIPFLVDKPQVGALYVLWHDHTLVPLHYLRRRNIGVMMSTSRAGQMQAAFWDLYGWPAVWGSTKKREGVRALREVLTLLHTGRSFGLTPDGPKGPRHHAQPGVVFLASKAGTPIYPLGVEASNGWQLSSWDRYLIPKPFSHVHLHLGPPLHPPGDLSREDTEIWRLKVEVALNEASVRARAELAGRSGARGASQAAETAPVQ